MNKTTASSRNPWLFVPSLYFAEGLPYVLINTVSVILYKRMGMDNDSIAFWTSSLYLPWVIKMLWGPLVDMRSTKRKWVLATQLAMGLCLGLTALSLKTDGFFFMSLAAFAAGAFISATHDIAADGFYMLGLTNEYQALFVGIRTTFYRLAMIFGSGLIVYTAGVFETVTGDVPQSWTNAMSIPALIFVLLFVYHKFSLPSPAADGERAPGDATRDSFVEIISSYFRQERIRALIAFILFYRFAEAMMLKLVTPFMLDPLETGGLGLSTKQVGLVYGTAGLICLITGGILGGWLISRYGLRKCIWPMAFILHLPDLVFVYMSFAQPDISVVFPLVALEQFGYGLGFTAFTVYLMYSARGRYKTSHFAISTGIMALGMMVPGAISGKIQVAVGYKAFFLIVMLMTIPGLLTVLFIPKDDPP